MNYRKNKIYMMKKRNCINKNAYIEFCRDKLLEGLTITDEDIESSIIRTINKLIQKSWR